MRIAVALCDEGGTWAPARPGPVVARPGRGSGCGAALRTRPPASDAAHFHARAAGRVLPHVRRAAGARPVRGRDRDTSRPGLRRGVPGSPGRGTRPPDQPAPGAGPRARAAAPPDPGHRRDQGRRPPKGSSSAARSWRGSATTLASPTSRARSSATARAVHRQRRQRLQLVHLLALRLLPQRRAAGHAAQDRVLPRRARRRQRRAARDARHEPSRRRIATRSTTRPATPSPAIWNTSSAFPRTSCRVGRSRRSRATSSCSTTRRCTPTSTAGPTGGCSRSSSPRCSPSSLLDVGRRPALSTLLCSGRVVVGGDAGWVPGGAVYRPHLDGLRAVAVYLVVLFHAGSSWFSGGYIGVDVFFVLSGFLVTQLLLRDIAGRGPDPVRTVLRPPVPATAPRRVRRVDRDRDGVHRDRVTRRSPQRGRIIQSRVLVRHELVLHPPSIRILRREHHRQPRPAVLVARRRRTVLPALAVRARRPLPRHPPARHHPTTPRHPHHRHHRRPRLRDLGAHPAHHQPQPRLLRHRHPRLRTPRRRVPRAHPPTHRHRPPIPTHHPHHRHRQPSPSSSPSQPQPSTSTPSNAASPPPSPPPHSSSRSKPPNTASSNTRSPTTPSSTSAKSPTAPTSGTGSSSSSPSEPSTSTPSPPSRSPRARRHRARITVLPTPRTTHPNLPTPQPPPLHRHRHRTHHQRHLRTHPHPPHRRHHHQNHTHHHRHHHRLHQNPHPTSTGKTPTKTSDPSPTATNNPSPTAPPSTAPAPTSSSSATATPTCSSPPSPPSPNTDNLTLSIAVQGGCPWQQNLYAFPATVNGSGAQHRRVQGAEGRPLQPRHPPTQPRHHHHHERRARRPDADPVPRAERHAAYATAHRR